MNFDKVIKEVKTEICFFVPGIPRPAGSKRAFLHSKTGKQIVIDTCKHTKDWRTDIIIFARKKYKGPPLDRPLSLDMIFYMPRPKGHYRTGKNKNLLKKSAPYFHTSKPDITKLIRAVEDALTAGGIWRDDSLVVKQSAMKVYSEKPGVEIKILDL